MRPTVTDDVDDAERADHPEERLEGVYGEEMVEAKEAGREQEIEGGEELGEAAGNAAPLRSPRSAISGFSRLRGG